MADEHTLLYFQRLETRGGNQELVPTDQFHWNCLPPTFSILLNDSLISLPARCFPFFLELCVVVHLLLTTQTFNCLQPKRRAAWRGGNDLKPGSISPKKNEMCNQCNAVILCKDANTSNMQKHLSTQHGIKYQECRVFNCLCTSAKTGQMSSTVAMEMFTLNVLHWHTVSLQLQAACSFLL